MMKLGHVGSLNVFDFHVSEKWYQVFIQVAPVALGGGGLTMGDDVFFHVALGQVLDEELLALERLFFLGVCASLDFTKHDDGLIAGPLGRENAMRADGDAFDLFVEHVLDVVGLFATRCDARAKSCQLIIEEKIRLIFCGGFFDDGFC